MAVGGGLWSFPEFADLTQVEEFCHLQLRAGHQDPECWPVVKHTFSHFHLQITPVCVDTATPQDTVMEPQRWLWYPLDESVAVGLAAPVKELLRRLRKT